MEIAVVERGDMEDKNALTVAEIADMHEKVQNGEIPPYEEDTPTWAELLYELAEKDHIQDEGIKAAIEYMRTTVSDGAEISSGKFESFMEDAYKLRWDTKGAYARQYAYEYMDTDTLDRMNSYINWNEYADDLSPDTVEYIQLQEGPFTPVWVFDPSFEF